MNKGTLYKCSVCGNIVEVINVGGGTLVCCGKPMDELIANTVDASKEKHVPVIEVKEDGVYIKVGSVPHPMEEKHYIMWIELVADGLIYRKYLKPGDNPEAFFAVKAKELVSYEYCNLHGLWKSQV
ncbi:desulfoferrodoxin [Caldicellulosiruptoraceae bacterium PP1]